MKKIIKGIYIGTSVLCLSIILLHCVVNYKKEANLDVNEYLQYEKGKAKEHAEFYDIQKMVLFDESLYCLNNEKCCVMVFSLEGKLEKVIQMPYIKKKGGNDMYLYHNRLCIRDKKGTLYQYRSFEKYEKLVLKGGNQIQIFDSAGKLRKTEKLKSEFDEIVAYVDGIYYLNNKESDNIQLYQNGIIGKEHMDHETMIYKNEKEVLTGNAVYTIGSWGDKLIRTDKKTKEILYRGTWYDRWVLSSRTSTGIIILWIALTLLSKCGTSIWGRFIK